MIMMMNLTEPRRRMLDALVKNGPLTVYQFPRYGHMLQTLTQLGWVRRNADGLFEITEIGRETLATNPVRRQ